MKVSTGRFQYTAIDDRTRLRVLGAYPRRTASNQVQSWSSVWSKSFHFRSNEFSQIVGESFWG